MKAIEMSGPFLKALIAGPSPVAEKKPWGTSLELNRQTYVRADGSIAVLCRIVRIFVKAGGYSSVHRHNQQSNAFYVSKGTLRLQYFAFDGQVAIECGRPFIQIPDDRPAVFQAGMPHQFLAITDVEALEIYVATHEGDASSEDIERFIDNGILNLAPFGITGYPSR